jgi:S1-C subfamily serine protease
MHEAQTNNEITDSIRMYKWGEEDGKPEKGKFLEGRHDYLDVTFPDTRSRRPARLANVSFIADAALIQIAAVDKFIPVNLADEEKVQPGDSITVMGYPAVSPDVYVKISSQDPFNRDDQWRVVPRPTVSNASIAKVISGQAQMLSNTTTEYVSKIGDAYQLNLNTTGAGNSGGPVFNDQGEVIGIFSSGNSDGRTQTTFAIPIKYGQELLTTPKIIK